MVRGHLCAACLQHSTTCYRGIMCVLFQHVCICTLVSWTFVFVRRYFECTFMWRSPGGIGGLECLVHRNQQSARPETRMAAPLRIFVCVLLCETFRSLCIGYFVSVYVSRSRAAYSYLRASPDGFPDSPPAPRVSVSGADVGKFVQSRCVPSVSLLLAITSCGRRRIYMLVH